MRLLYFFPSVQTIIVLSFQGRLGLLFLLYPVRFTILLFIAYFS